MNQVPETIKVRTASVGDADFIVKANLTMAWETENLRLDEAVLTAGVEAVFRGDKAASYLIVEIDQLSVGCLMVTTEWSDWRNKPIAWIQSLFVLEEFRGQGAFKAMFSHLEKLVADGVYAGIRLYADKTNEKAQNVYKRLGMDCEHYLMFEKMK